MKKIILMAFAAIAMSVACIAQSIGPATINSTGGSYAMAGNTHEWSIGEMALVHTWSAGNLVITQGILQPKEGPVSVESQFLNNRNISLFPNPARDIVHFQYAFNQDGELQYSLVDAAGKLVLVKKVNTQGNGREDIALHSLANGVYMLHICFKPAGSQQENVSFKIQKIK